MADFNIKKSEAQEKLATLNDIISTLGDIKSDVKNKTEISGDVWVGAVKDAYDSAIDIIVKDVENLAGVVSDRKAKFEKALQRYAQADDETVSQAEGMSTDVGTASKDTASNWAT